MAAIRGMRLVRLSRGRYLFLALPLVALTAVATALMATNIVPVTYAGQSEHAIAFQTQVNPEAATATETKISETTTSVGAHFAIARDDAKPSYSASLSAALVFDDPTVSGAIGGQMVTFSSGGVSCSSMSNASGVASCTVVGLPSVPSSYTATFGGDGSLQASHGTGSIAAPASAS